MAHEGTKGATGTDTRKQNIRTHFYKNIPFIWFLMLCEMTLCPMLVTFIDVSLRASDSLNKLFTTFSIHLRMFQIECWMWGDIQRLDSVGIDGATYLHFVWVDERDLIGCQLPDGVESKWIRCAGVIMGGVQHFYPRVIFLCGNIPVTPKNVQWLREAIVIDETSIDGERTHKEDDVSVHRTHEYYSEHSLNYSLFRLYGKLEKSSFTIV